MAFTRAALTSIFIATVSASNYVVGDVWSTLTPAGTMTSATTDYTQTFGIAVEPITSSVALTSATATTSSNSRDYAKIISQITDGQIQAATTTITPSPSSTVAIITQIGDGQIQAQVSSYVPAKTTSSTAKTTNVITQIGDGQIQAKATTTSSSDSITTTYTEMTTEVAVVTDVVTVDCDSSSTTTSSTDAPVSSSSSDEITYVTVHPTETVLATDYLSTATQTISPTVTVALSKRDNEVSCLTNSSLAMTLKDSVLTDAKGRIGAIVSNQQFQFDGPPPQSGSIYAAGWSVTDDGYLALGNSTTFYQCLSGSFYNLYNEIIGSQCEAVHLNVVDLVSC